MNDTATVVGVFDNEKNAREAVEALTSSGFTRDLINLSSSSDYSEGADRPAEQHEGGFTGWLKSIFGGDDTSSDDYTARYDEAARHGGYVVSVQTDDAKADQAVNVLNEKGAIDVDEHAARQGYAESRPNGSASEESRPAGPASESNVIPVIEEELRVGKRSVQRGGVRVFSRVVEQPVAEEVKLSEEKVRIERRPANRPVTDADRARLRDQTIEVTEMAEEPVVQKEARVVEEVVVGKEVSEKTQNVRDTVRRTEVRTENLGANQTDQDEEFRRDFETRYAPTGATWESCRPAYLYGYRMAGQSQYRGKTWDDVESTLKTDYLRQNPNSTWDKAKGAVRYGWERTTGRR